MRKANWVAAAAGVVLLVAGCGSNGGSDNGGSGKGKTSVTSGGSTGGGSETGGGDLTADAVKKEIETAATGAGFTQDASGDKVPAGTEQCMVMWTADSAKAADQKKSYKETVTALGQAGWSIDKNFEQSGSTIKTLSKGTWLLKASDHSMGMLKMDMFIATDAKPECEAALKAAGPQKTP
ncbi:hypothetical protein ACFYU9_09405 [Streptomyces sp. NPDC004327]|uniref:hypothetical protein n=1 Tax=Streptomyces sp. NPDC004327 TaxID=3364699 RepID=UPI00369D6BB6